MRKLIAALLTSVAMAAPAAAQVPHIQVVGQVLYFSGEIGYGDQAVFDGAVKGNDVHTVVLSSGGGLVDQALTMAKLIHERGMATVIPGNELCASACAMMFLAGKEKAMGPRANLGLHAAIDETGMSTPGTAMMAHFLVDIAAAPLDVLFQIDATPPNQMWWLPADRRAEMGIQSLGE